MKDQEKQLIENLFHRLKKTELNMSERDIPADNLIQNLVSKQPSAPYYMTQTILIQETAINKMNTKIQELEKRIKLLNTEISNKKPSFLSSFFNTNANSSSQPISNDNNIWRNKENTPCPHYSHLSTSSNTQQPIPVVNNINGNSSRNSGFLSSALQTATGVAGGMILGNMLMNIFNHSNKPEEEIFDTVHKYNADNYTEDNTSDYHKNNDLVNYQYTDAAESNQYNESNTNLEDWNSDVYHGDNGNNIYSDDDNFI